MRAAALFIAISLVGSAAQAGQTGLDGALGILVFRPVSADLNETYALGAGVAGDFGLVFSERFRMSVQVAPQFARGTPASGSLAVDPSGNLFLLPALAVVQYTHPAQDLHPYFGLGAGVLYAHESVSFSGPLGDEERSASTTRFSWTVMAGLEKGNRSRLFVEAYYLHAGTASIEGQSGSGVSLASLQLRVGWRTSLK